MAIPPIKGDCTFNLNPDESECNIDNYKEYIVPGNEVICNLKGADFSDKHLKDSSFQFDMLQDVNFTNADLTGANFSNADLRGADFTHADLRGAIFTNAIVTPEQAEILKTFNIEGFEVYNTPSISAVAL